MACGFRADLLYRLRVARIQLPALREVSADAMQRLLEHDWPGNVRELRSTIEYAVLHSRDRQIVLQDLPPELRQSPASQPLTDYREAEKQELLLALAQARGNRRQAARLLGIGKSTLYRRLARHDISHKV